MPTVLCVLKLQLFAGGTGLALVGWMMLPLCLIFNRPLNALSAMLREAGVA